MTTEQPKTKQVSDLLVLCSYPLRPDAIAASDNCRGMATSVVVTTDGRQLFRCDEHKGLVKDGQTGEIVHTVTVRR